MVFNQQARTKAEVPDVRARRIIRTDSVWTQLDPVSGEGFGEISCKCCQLSRLRDSSSTWPNRYSGRCCIGFTVCGSVVAHVDSHAGIIGSIARTGNRPTYGRSLILRISRDSIWKSQLDECTACTPGLALGSGSAGPFVALPPHKRQHPLHEPPSANARLFGT